MIRQQAKSAFSIELLARRYVSSLHSGVHISSARGTEFEFKEYRPYSSGDKLSSIDWRYYARSDQLHIRMREGKDNIGIHIFIDRSLSMSFGSDGALHTKFELAKILGCIVALIAKQQRDSYCLGFSGFENSHLVFGDDVFSELESQDYMQKSCVWSRLKPEKNISQGDIIFIFSDFYTPMDKLFELFSPWHMLGAEIILAHVCDLLDYQLPPKQNLCLIDCETNHSLNVSTDVIAKEFKEAFDRHCKNLKELSRSLNGSYHFFSTQEPPERQFDSFLKLRKKGGQIC